MYSLFLISIVSSLFYLIVVVESGQSPFQLITRDASIRNGKVLASYLSAEDSVDPAAAVVAVVDLCADPSIELVNKIFDSKFKPDICGKLVYHSTFVK